MHSIPEQNMAQEMKKIIEWHLNWQLTVTANTDDTLVKDSRATKAGTKAMRYTSEDTNCQQQK